jgi:hypothetical protein
VVLSASGEMEGTQMNNRIQLTGDEAVVVELVD